MSCFKFLKIKDVQKIIKDKQASLKNFNINVNENYIVLETSGYNQMLLTLAQAEFLRDYLNDNLESK